MALTNGPKLGLLVNGTQGEVHYNELMRLLRGLDSLIQGNVKSATVTVTPILPADGDTYIVPADGLFGAWVGHEKAIARYNAIGSAWEFYTPKAGWEMWSEATSTKYRYVGGVWGSI